MTQKLFISYSHHDNMSGRWLQRLTVFLDALREALPLTPWSDQGIKSGEKWREKIETVLGETSAALLLIGPGFLASEFIREHELPPLLEAVDAKRIRLYPLIVAYCPWPGSVLEPYQAFNDPSEPLESLDESAQNKQLNDLALTIARDMREANVLAPAHSNDGDLYRVIQAIGDHLETTHAAFIQQARLRDKLVAMLRDRLVIRERLQFERLFLKYYDDMNTEERFEFIQIRGITESTLYDGNRAILDLIETHPNVRGVLPILGALKIHLRVWLNKYERVFTKVAQMALLYVGVEDGVPFPYGVDAAVSEWLADHRVLDK